MTLLGPKLWLPRISRQASRRLVTDPVTLWIDVCFCRFCWKASSIPNPNGSTCCGRCYVHSGFVTFHKRRQMEHTFTRTFLIVFRCTINARSGPHVFRYTLYIQNKGWTNFQGRAPSSRNKFTYRLELLQLYQFWTGVYTCTCSGGIARKSVQSGRVSPKLWDKGHRGSRIAPLGSSDVTDSIVSTSLFERTRATLSSPTRRYLA